MIFVLCLSLEGNRHLTSQFDSSYGNCPVAYNGYKNGYNYYNASLVRGRYNQPINHQHDDNELITKILTVESKRFYIDVKENRIGRFIKISQVGYFYILLFLSRFLESVPFVGSCRERSACRSRA